MPYDVAVVGAGPAGGFTAKLLANAGYNVVLLEEHRTVGQPVQCGGLFTPRIFELLDFDVSHTQRNPVRGAHITSPKGHRITIRSDHVQAIATDRAAFDEAIVERAAKAGAELRLGVKATGARREDGRVSVELATPSGPETLQARLLVGADGVQSQVAAWFRLGKPREILSFYGAEMRGLRMDPELVELWTGQRVAPGFFAYAIPTSRDGTQGKVEVGVCRPPQPAKHYFERLFENPLAKPVVGGGEPLFPIVGCIPLGLLPAMSTSNVMLVGDAACQAKPTSGGGVYMGLAASRILAEVASSALKTNDLSADRLSEYGERFHAELGGELKFGNRLRRAFMFLRDEEVEDLFVTLDEPDIVGLIEKHGDIDFVSKVAWALFRKAPRLFRFSGAWLKSLFKDVPAWPEA